MSLSKIYIDDQPLEIKAGQNLLHAALSHGHDVPYFCWHPALGSVGACRQCAVIQYKDADDKKGRLVMSCMTPALDGTRISIDHVDAKNFRASVIEWLMTNHPHDCPVCDEGGECHLQDMTVMSGHNYRNFRFNKRTFKNQNLGPLINHEMNRCITCYRCVRYYRDLAGGDDLNSFASSNRVYFGRAEDGTLESEFSGNLVEICPTGVFTDKSFKQNYTRKWDLQMAPSVCQLCSLGCNITPGERGNILRRVQNRFHSEINGYFICDKGRFGHSFVNSPDRVRKPLMRTSRTEAQKEVTVERCFSTASSAIASAKAVVGIGSSRASLESNFALRSLVGADNFYSDTTEKDYECVSRIHHILEQRTIHSPSLKEIEESDCVVILGEDLTNTAPMMAFSVRQVVFRQAQEAAGKLQIPDWNDAAIRNFSRDKTGPIHSFQVSATKLDNVARTMVHTNPHQIARIALAIAHELNSASPLADGISAQEETYATQVAMCLRDAKNPIIIAGASLGSTAIIEAASNIAVALKSNGNRCGLSYVLPVANSLGLQMLRPKPCKDLHDVKNLEVAIVLENESHVEADCIIALDYLNHRSLSRADIVFPVATFAEGTGSLVNNEGRAQRYYRVFAPEEPVCDSWKTLAKLKALTSSINDLATLDQVTAAMRAEIPELAEFCEHVVKSSLRVCGQKIPRASSEQSGRTAINAHKSIHEQKPPEDPDSPYAHSMEGAQLGTSGVEAAVVWAPKWNSVQSLNKFQDEVGGPLKGGSTGVCLFPEKEKGNVSFFSPKNVDFATSSLFSLIPLHDIFRHDLRTSHSGALVQRRQPAKIFISSQDAGERKLTLHASLNISVSGRDINLPIEISDAVPKGWLLVPKELL